MPQMTLTRMPTDEPVGLTFTEATEFNIDNGAEGATILALTPPYQLLPIYQR